MTNDALNAEFSISITKAAGEPQMNFNVDATFNEAFNALISLLSDLTLSAEWDVDALTEMNVETYRKVVARKKKAGEKP